MATVNLADYDSSAVRAAAKKLRSCANELSGNTKGKLQTIRTELPSNLEGDTAQALQARLADLTGDVNTILSSISGLVSALEKYADDLDRAMVRLKQQLQG